MLPKRIVHLCNIALLSLLAISTSANATLIMTLSGEAGSSIVEFELSGSAISAGSFESDYAGTGFQITDSFDPFPSQILNFNNGVYPFLTGGATISNVTKGITTQGIAIYLQDDSFLGVPRFGISAIQSQALPPIAIGDVLSWSGSGTFNLAYAGLIFDDLLQGRGKAFEGFVGKIDGELRIQQVKVNEPSSIMLLLMVVAAIVIHRKRNTIA